jgi:hypothetical protein
VEKGRVMDNDLFEIAKKNVWEKSFIEAEKYIYHLARNRRILFSQFRELNKINRESDV